LRFSREIIGKRPGFTDLWSKHKEFLAGIILILAVMAIYRQTAWFDFILFDDPGYVLKNPLVNKGLSWDYFCGIWANITVSNWHPLTIFSHQLDVTIYGLNAGGHHLTNVLLHAINVLLLFMVMKSFTGTLWRSFFVALLFAIHPLHVESVAWISERKDMLSMLFGLLSLLAYRRYTGKPGFGHMANVAIFFSLSLMSKPMLVTLPFLMLLLDWWPLCRFKSYENSLTQNENSRINWKNGIHTLWRFAFEKWPLFLLSAGSCAITMVTQHASGAVMNMEYLSFCGRLSNAITALFKYLNKMLWPSGLGVFYPFPPQGHSAALISLSVGIALALTTLAFFFARRRPWWFTGWFWFLGTLVPVLGLVQVGSQSWADRYTYWPLTGVFIIIVWEGVALWNAISSFKTRILYMILVLAAISVLGFTAWRQTSYWKNTELLFKHTVEMMPNNWLAHGVLGIAVTKEGRLDEALEHYCAAYETGPKSANACNDLGKIYALRGNMELSLKWHLRAIETEPKSTKGYYCAANTLVKLGRSAEAESAYLKAISLDPAFSDALFNYANMLRDVGRHKDAEIRYRELIKSKPDYIGARLNLATMLASDNKHAAAIEEYSQILSKEPKNTMALNNMGKSLLFLGRPEEASRLFAKAVELRPDDADVRFSFALALAASGRKDQALMELRAALKINPSHSASIKLMNELSFSKN
jgi:tetratricopeptide (TPR) repeat protein